VIFPLTGATFCELVIFSLFSFLALERRLAVRVAHEVSPGFCLQKICFSPRRALASPFLHPLTPSFSPVCVLEWSEDFLPGGPGAFFLGRIPDAARLFSLCAPE